MSVDRDFLIEYKAKENDEVIKFIKKFREGRITSQDRYPPPDRLKLNEPYTRSFIGDDFWAQISSYGTTIINLKPVKKQIFEEVHGFQLEDLDRLMDFAKKTGRVKFALDFDEDIMCYRNLDILEPIFMDKDLRPPQLIHLPPKAIFNEEEIKKAYNEIKPLLENPRAQSFVRGYINEKYDDFIHAQEYVTQGIIDDMIKFKLSGHEDLVEEFVNELTHVSPRRIVSILYALHDMFFYSFDPLKGLRSFKRFDLNDMYDIFPFCSAFSKNKELPCEVGRFLNDKLKLIVPKDLDGAISLSDEYDLYDLRNVMTALNDGVEKLNPDNIYDNIADLFTIFENVWSDTVLIKRNINYYKHGINLSIGVGIGFVMPMSGILGSLVGVVGATGISEFLIPKISESFAEKIAKLINPGYLFSVYDFKKKYQLF